MNQKEKEINVNIALYMGYKLCNNNTNYEIVISNKLFLESVDDIRFDKNYNLFMPALIQLGLELNTYHKDDIIQVRTLYNMAKNLIVTGTIEIAAQYLSKAIILLKNIKIERNGK